MESRDARPLIAVTTSEVRASESVSPTPGGEPPLTEMALGLTYLRALERAGAIPVVIPPLTQTPVDAVLDRSDGLCLSGGPDLDPHAYGARRHRETGPVHAALDAFELELARAADARAMPILAICRGMQLLNVARGGTLHQHLPDVAGTSIAHRQTEPGSRPTHWVSLDRDAKIADLLGRRRLKVNSFHHQGIDRVGERLTITGRAADGTIESVEATDRPFVLGVQWHAESLADRPEQAAIFRAFVEHARPRPPTAARLRAA